MMIENEILLYTTKDGDVKVDVLYNDNNMWLTQKKMAMLFDVQTPAINKHLKNIFETGELQEKAVISILETTAADGKKYQTQFYNLEAIIAVGYRVNSERGTAFRVWATDKLKQYISKGFAIDSARFKKGSKFDSGFFDELLEEIRDIRASERMAYQKITDIFATSVDYNPNANEASKFFATVQNKLHFAITGHTAAEIIEDRADHSTPNMGLTTWKKAPDGKIMLSDVIVAKNYLTKDEISKLNRIVSMYLDYAELQASSGKIMQMKNWEEKLNAFLKFNEQEILNDQGKVTHEIAITLATDEYEIFRKKQDQLYQSDFDKLLAAANLKKETIS